MLQIYRIHYKNQTNTRQKISSASNGWPSINWNVLDGLDEQLIENGHTKTIKIGSCAQHIVHGALQNGFCQADCNIDKVLKSLYFLLNNLPAHRSIYSEVGNTNKFPLR